MFRLFIAVAFWSFSLGGLVWAAEHPSESSNTPGVTATSVTFVQIAALDGAAAALGQGMQVGLQAAFQEANANGGVHGREVHLDSFDDGYQPQQSATILKEIVAKKGHFALIGSVGTPTASAMQPQIKAVGMPMVGPFTGAAFLRNIEKGPIVNVRATYAAEAEAWMSYLVEKKGYSRIAILYQDDGFGRVGLSGARAALDKRNMTLVAEGTYTRNSRAVKEALLDIRAAEPDAVVMVGAYKPIAEFIRWSRRLDFNPEFLNISFVGSAALSEELGEDGTGVIISQVVPFPWDTTIPLVAAYQSALARFDPTAQPDFVSLEGYLVGRVALEALENAGRDLDRESFMESVASLGTIDLGGVTLSYAVTDNQGMDDVFLTKIGGSNGFSRIQ